MKKNPQKYDDTVVRYFDDDVVILYDAYPKVCIVVSGILFFLYQVQSTHRWYRMKTEFKFQIFKLRNRMYGFNLYICNLSNKINKKHSSQFFSKSLQSFSQALEYLLVVIVKPHLQRC